MAKKASRSSKMIYYFGKTKTEGDGSKKAVLGGKGANLAEMTSIGLPVPPGFTITTEVCDLYYKNKRKLPSGLLDSVRKNVKMLEKELGKKFGDTKEPLLVSVRSGAAVSMPGMMNTILNLGLNDESVVGLANATGNERFAYDAYRRLINMYGDVVCGVDHEHFEQAFDKIKKRYKAAEDNDVPLKGMIELCEAYKRVFKKHFGKPFPQDPRQAAGIGCGSGIQELDANACGSLPSGGEYHWAQGHSCQRPIDGLWQHGRRFRDRRGIHARPCNGREQVLRRISD